MSETIAESLAKEVLDGTYTPSVLADCKPDVPIDRNPHVVRYTQFILFVMPKLDIRSPGDPAYLILQQYEPSDRGRKPISDFIKSLAAALGADVGTRALRAAPALQPLPDPEDARVEIGRIRLIAVERGIPGYGPELSDTDVRALYKGWLLNQNRTKLLTIVDPLRRAGFPLGEAMSADIKNLPSALEDIFTRILLPDPYQPFPAPFLHFALCATYEQVWEPRGYTRGELISSISLAPGEQLTLDIHSWDKSTIKSEEELATESEMRVSENLTQRDVHSVTREVASQLSGKLTASGITIPHVPATFGGEASSSVTDSTKTTTEHLRERTVQASNTLKSTRKLRIEVSREVGREQRQTRAIANSNRCHTLNCHYFEVMANYLVTTNRVDLKPCLLAPTPTVEVTAPWVLCHEDVLTQALLDKAFLPGFDAARTLEASLEFKEIVKEQASEEVQAYVQAILDAYNALGLAADAVKRQSGSQLASGAAAAAGTNGLAVTMAVTVTPDKLRESMYLAMLATNRAAINALEKLKKDCTPPQPGAPTPRHPIDGLKDFLAVVPPSAYRPYVNFAALWTGIGLLGIPTSAINPLIAWAWFGMVPDDSGLFNAVQAADRKLKAMEKSAQDQPTTVEQGFATLDVAKARVAFAELKCHIEDNWLHYVQAMWQREDPDQRFVRLQGYGAVAAVLENNVLGFLGNKSAFPISSASAVKPQIDFDAIIKGVGAQASPPQLITVPTQGMLLEAIVGKCDACEDFIQQSRVLDLRTQEAKTKQEEAEAKRREMRLAAQPPDLSDPRATGGNVVVNVSEPTSPPHT